MAVDCRVRLAWKRATQALYRSLDGVTIADLMKESIDGFGEL
jgi:DNA-binding IscR family transcriptional regulator